jgi:GxxExxY protein
MNREWYNKLSKEILDACFVVHKALGPGLLESVYEMCLMYEFSLRNIAAKNQVEVPLIYKGKVLSKEFRIDILIENEIVMELKAVEAILPVHEAQIISYLKLADKRLGFLVNFNVPVMKNGFKRYVNNF